MLKSIHIKSFLMVLGFVGFGFRMYSQHHISQYEVRWALFHPFTAIKIKRQLPKVMEVYKSVKQVKVLDTLESGGKLDAFRHIYTMAYLGRSIKSKKLRKLGVAHERGNKRQFVKEKLEDGERPDSLACEMDLRNNEIGIDLGRSNRETTNEELKQLVIENIVKGNAWYLKRNSRNEYVNCSGEPIDFKQYIGKWSLPKCLVKTKE